MVDSPANVLRAELRQGGGGEVILKVKSGCVRELSTSATVVKKVAL